MEKIINGEKFEIYELDGELRIRRNGFDMPLYAFEEFSKVNPKFYKLSDDEILDLFKKLRSDRIICK